MNYKCSVCGEVNKIDNGSNLVESIKGNIRDNEMGAVEGLAFLVKQYRAEIEELKQKLSTVTNKLNIQEEYVEARVRELDLPVAIRMVLRAYLDGDIQMTFRNDLIHYGDSIDISLIGE